MANSPTTPEQSVREQLGLIDVWLKEMSIRTVETWEDARLNQAATAAVWIETSEKIKTLLDQISAERASLARSECIQDIKDYGLTIENGKWITDSVIEGMYKARSDRSALRQPTGEEK